MIACTIAMEIMQEVTHMGKAARIKAQRREVRREIERQARDPRQRQAVEALVKELRAECYSKLSGLVDDALSELYGFGDTRKARLWAHVKASALWEPYMEQALPIDEVVGE